jgi:hypothetical protein
VRLTLRTLLAYLDDILEPSHAREIGEKIAESAVASGMVTRVREVLRRRRITAPDVTGPTATPDPNVVAEYLDNTLSPEGVAELERICLESDMHLAEVAACHQVLTLVLGEPVDIPPQMRERMYALGAIAPASSEGNGHGTERVAAGQTLAAPPIGSAAGGSAALASLQPATVPDYLRRRPLWHKLLPIAAALVVAGWLGLVLRDPAFGTRGTAGRTKAPDAATAIVMADGQAARPDVPSTPAGGNGATQRQPPTDTVPAVAAVIPGANASIDPEPPPDMPEPLPTVPPTTDATATAVPPAPQPAEAVNVAVVPPPPPPAVVPGDVAPAAPENLPQILYNSPDGILLHYVAVGDAGEQEWVVMPRRAFVHPGERIASPEPFAAKLVVGDSLCNITLSGGTSVQSLGRTPAAAFGIAVDRGRVGLHRPAGRSTDPVALGLKLGEHVLRVELMEPETLCGVEVLLRQPSGEPNPPQPPGIDGGLFVAAGTVQLTDVNGQKQLLTPEKGWLSLFSVDGPPQPARLRSIPEWLMPEGSPLTPIQRGNAALYERAFALDQPVAHSVPALVKDRRPKMSELAVQTLGLIDDHRQLVRALQADHEEARLAAITALRQWLPRAAENAPLLREEIDRVFRNADVDVVYELLWGYDQDDARDPMTSRRLVQWLAHDDLAIRELAFFHVFNLTGGRRNDYRPNDRLTQRQASVVRWEELVERQGALLPPN